MSTRGAWGFLIDGKTKAIYNPCDSYPTGLGTDVFLVCAEVQRAKAWEHVRKRIRRIEMVDPSAVITQEQYRKIRRLLHKSAVGVITPGVDWEFFFSTSGLVLGIADLIKGTAIPFAPDSASYLGDSLSCEWAYIVNLDSQCIEVHCGFNRDRWAPGRYSHTTDPETGYCGVRLLLSIPFDALDAMESIDSVAAEIEKCGSTNPPDRDYFVFPQWEPLHVRLDGITSIQTL